MKLTARSNMSKTYYWGKHGLLQTCSFLSDLTVGYAKVKTQIFIRSELASKDIINFDIFTIRAIEL